MEFSLMLFQTFLHVTQANTLDLRAIMNTAWRDKPLAIVGDHKRYAPAGCGEPDLHIVGVCMAFNIGQGFLGDTKQCCFCIGWQQFLKGGRLNVDFNTGSI